MRDQNIIFFTFAIFLIFPCQEYHIIGNINVHKDGIFSFNLKHDT